MHRFLMGLLACILPFSASHAVEVTQAAVVVPVNPASLYIKHCAICHGDNGDANTRVQSGLRPLPRDFTSVAAAMELTRDRMIDSVTNGRPGTGMMPHKNRLTSGEISSIVDFIRTKFMRNPGQIKGTAKHLKGEKIYTRHCAVCHGDSGNTAFWAQNGLNPPPRNFTDPKVRRELSRERMITSITNGRPGTGMMPFSKRLSQQDIREVVSFIRNTFMQPDTGDLTQPTAKNDVENTLDNNVESPTSAVIHSSEPMPSNPHQGMPAVPEPLATVKPADMSLPFQNKLKGNVTAGRDFFMANCFTCHGVKGNGQGPRAYFNTPRPRDFTNEASRQMLNRVRLFAGIKNGRTGTVMPAWGKVLTEQQIANVAEFVFQTFILAKDDADGQPTKKNL